MLGALAGEWVKLRRRSVLLWGLGGGALFTVFATVLTIERARTAFSPGANTRFHVTIAELARPDGLVHGVLALASLVGIVALCLFAATIGAEYSQGTLRNLLVREPRRGRLLAGTFLALALFLAVAIVLAVASAAGVAFALAPSRGIDITAWTNSSALDQLGQTVLHVYLGSVGYGLLGTALAVALRSPTLAFAIGVAYALPGEAILARLWDGGERWLPAQLLNALAHGGTDHVTYAHALVSSLGYATIAAGSTLIVFERQDI
jgi:ABC-2 type transport system permease protein